MACSRSISPVLIPSAVFFFASQDRFRISATWPIRPRSSACFISMASPFSWCRLASDSAVGVTMRRCCSAMITSERRETPVKQMTSEVSNSLT